MSIIPLEEASEIHDTMGISPQHAQNLKSLLTSIFVSLLIDPMPGQNLNDEGKSVPFIASGFIVAVRGEWYLITAAHVIEEIEHYTNNGVLSDTGIFFDAFNPNSRFRNRQEMVPFRFSTSTKFFLRGEMQDIRGDFACILLPNNTARLLAVNGVTPLSHENVSTPDKFDRFWLAGVPSQHTKVAQQRTHLTLSMVALEQVDKESAIQGIRSDDYEKHVKRTTDYIYCRLPNPDEMQQDGSALTSVKGMSGGPIVGTVVDPENGVGLCLLAIQSGWFERRAIIYGAPAWVLISTIMRAQDKDAEYLRTLESES